SKTFNIKRNLGRKFKMTVKIGINGFGRIGRNIFRQALNNDGVEVVAINDLTDAKMLAHLLEFDSVHGKLAEEITVDGDDIVIGGKKMHVYSEQDPKNIPWSDHGVEVVVESTGRFTKREDANKHIEAGAKKVRSEERRVGKEWRPRWAQ